MQAALLKNIGVGVIPSSLRETIIGSHLEDALATPEYAYSDEKTTYSVLFESAVGDRFRLVDTCRWLF